MSSSASSEHSATRIPALDVGASYRELKVELDQAYQRVMGGGRYVLGAELEAFEAEFASFCQVRYCVGVGNGLEALFLALHACGIGEGDEVIVPAHTFIATWLAVSRTGARPVPVEPDEGTFNIDPGRVAAAITDRTRAIIAVHLYGQPAAMDELQELAASRGLRLIEDAAQAHGARWKHRSVGSLGDVAAFSFYPAKNLGAYGDGGAVLSNDAHLISNIRALRNYGANLKHRHDQLGFNSRLDPLQAAFLRVRLRRLEEWNKRRATVAKAYCLGLASRSTCVLPAVRPEASPAWHQFVIRHAQRDRLRRALEERGIETAIHYPEPPHLSGAYTGDGRQYGKFPIAERLADTVLSMPMGPHLAADSVQRVISAVIEAEAAIA